VPVITTDVGGLAETVRPGETGLVVPPADPAALAAAIVRFFEEGLAPRLREGVQALQAAHSWDVLAQHAIELVDALAARPGLAVRPAPTARAGHAAARGSVGRTALALAVAAFLLYALTGGGRVVGSDEVTMLELSRAMLRGGIVVPEGSTIPGRTGVSTPRTPPARPCSHCRSSHAPRPGPPRSGSIPRNGRWPCASAHPSSTPW